MNDIKLDVKENLTKGETFWMEIDGKKIEVKEKLLENGKWLSEILISTFASIEFLQFKKALDNKEYKKVYTSKVFDAIDMLCNETNITYLNIDTKVFRARIVRDITEIYHEQNGIHFDGEVLRGYDWYNSKEPAVGISFEGRANSKYSSYFYCADDGPTAASEIKANIGDYISLASFLVKRELKLIKLEEKDWFEGKTKTDCYQDLIANHFSIPISDSSEYRLTQFISDELRKHGIDGLSYKSHFTNKTNYVIFNCSMDAIEFVNSKIIRLYSQQLRFVDFSNLKMLSTIAIPNIGADEIKNEKEYLYSVIQSERFKRNAKENSEDREGN